MKKLATMLLGLSLALGTVTAFAQDQNANSPAAATTKAKRAKPAKVSKAKPAKVKPAKTKKEKKPATTPQQ